MKIISIPNSVPKSSDYTVKELSKTKAGREAIKLIKEGLPARDFLYLTLEKYLEIESEKKEKGTCFGKSSVLMTTFANKRSEKEAVKKANMINIVAFQLIESLRAGCANDLRGANGPKSDEYKENVRKFLAKVEQTGRFLVERKSNLKFDHVKIFPKKEKNELLDWIKKETEHVKYKKVFRIGVDAEKGGHSVALFLRPNQKMKLYDSAQGFITFDNQKELLKHVKSVKTLASGNKIINYEVEVFKYNKTK